MLFALKPRLSLRRLLALPIALTIALVAACAAEDASDPDEDFDSGTRRDSGKTDPDDTPRKPKTSTDGGTEEVGIEDDAGPDGGKAETGTCKDKCTKEGESTCATPTMYYTCERGKDGCLAYTPVKYCKTSSVCFSYPKECFGTCPTPAACTLGQAKCTTPTQYQKCITGPDGCPKWSDLTYCKTSTACFTDLKTCTG